MNNHRYKFAVLVDSNESWRNWVAKKVYRNKPASITMNRFTLRDIEYIKVLTPESVRGFKFDAIIEDFGATQNPNYHQIINSIRVCFLY